MSELLPAPLGPTRPNILLPMESERFLSAFTPLGYVLDRPVMVSATRASRFQKCVYCISAAIYQQGMGSYSTTADWTEAVMTGDLQRDSRIPFPPERRACRGSWGSRRAW